MKYTENNWKVQIEKLLAQMEAFAAEHRVPIINENGRRVFIDVVQSQKPHRVLEIGTAIGYSALLTALHGADDVRIVSLELSAERAAEAQDFISRSPYADRIEIVMGDAGENLKQLNPAEKFDMVFIDAAKGQYPDYLEKVLPLLADDGIIVADNVLFRGYVCSEDKPPRRYKTIVKRLREYLAAVNDGSRFATKIYENGDGLAVTRQIR